MIRKKNFYLKFFRHDYLTNDFFGFVCTLSINNVLDKSVENEKCETVPSEPFSIWSCEWSASNTIKTCQKSCFDNFQLTSGSRQLKCHFKNGWIEKMTAQCIPKPVKNCDDFQNVTSEAINLKIETCSKYEMTVIFQLNYEQILFSYFTTSINLKNFTNIWTLIINFNRDLEFFQFNIENGNLALKTERQVKFRI